MQRKHYNSSQKGQYTKSGLVLTKQELAVELGVVERWIEEHQGALFPVIRCGPRLVRYHLPDVIEALKAQSSQKEPLSTAA